MKFNTYQGSWKSSFFSAINHEEASRPIFTKYELADFKLKYNFERFLNLQNRFRIFGENADEKFFTWMLITKKQFDQCMSLSNFFQLVKSVLLFLRKRRLKVKFWVIHRHIPIFPILVSKIKLANPIFWWKHIFFWDVIQ